MQDQGKRLLLAVGLALGVMLLWNAFFSPKTEDQKKKPTTPTAVLPSATFPTTLVGTAPGAPVSNPKQIALTFPKVVATFSSKGGVLESWHLTDSRYEHDDTKGEMLASDRGAFAVGFTKDSTFQLPAESDQSWTGRQVDARTVEYTYSTPEVDITKDFVVDADAFIVRAKIAVKPKAASARETLAVTTWQLQDPKKTGGGSSRIQPRQWDSSTLRAGEIVTTPVTSLIEKGPRQEENIQWTGFEQPYLLVGYAPTPDAHVTKDTFGEPDGLMRTDLLYPTGTSSAEVVAYLGPKNVDQLEHADEVAGFATGFKQTIDLGWFSFIGRPLLWLLLRFHDVFRNWGIAILFLTMLVKGATLYWTTKSMRSMKAMAVLGPQMKALQEKYKDDKQRIQVETMALYKQNGVNPLAGCLPILLQMPIWLALYRMLQSAGELYQQPFIPGWINDLTNNDPTYVLPIALIVLMFVQARLQPANPDPSQKMQQRMMQYGMPLMFGVFCLWAPAGLTLYIFANTCLSALHSIYMNKYDKKSIELAAKLKVNQAAVAADKDAAAAKAAKDANPPKDEPPKKTPNKGKKGRR
ncbi:MAG TPA: membrane protein insertase YidC [Kofleriaceae bacterium]|nr:membrane protein insertase YidC [Kofleriaceae bacterium]